MNVSEIIDAVRNGPDATHSHPLRPFIDENTCEDEVANLMRRCWAEEPQDRPDFNVLKNTIRKLNKWVFTWFSINKKTLNFVCLQNLIGYKGKMISVQPVEVEKYFNKYA